MYVAIKKIYGVKTFFAAVFFLQADLCYSLTVEKEVGKIKNRHQVVEKITKNRKFFKIQDFVTFYVYLMFFRFNKKIHRCDFAQLDHHWSVTIRATSKVKKVKKYKNATGSKKLSGLRTGTRSKRMTRCGYRVLLFTAACEACHKGIAGFLLKVRQCVQDLRQKLSTKPSIGPHPAYTPYFYLRYGNARTNIFTINPAFYLASRALFTVSLT